MDFHKKNKTRSEQKYNKVHSDIYCLYFCRHLGRKTVSLNRWAHLRLITTSDLLIVRDIVQYTQIVWHNVETKKDRPSRASQSFVVISSQAEIEVVNQYWAPQHDV